MKELSKKELIGWLDDAASCRRVEIVTEREHSTSKQPPEFWENMYKREAQACKQIRKMIEEKPKVTKKFVEQWSDIVFGTHSFPDYDTLEEMLKEAGVEVEK